MLPLIGILIVVVGFALRLNPLLVVVAAAVATGLSAGHGLTDVVAAFGKAFIDSRSVAVVVLALPVIGLLERSGLKERARMVISQITVATAGRCFWPTSRSGSSRRRSASRPSAGIHRWSGRSLPRWPRRRRRRDWGGWEPI